MNGDSVRGMPPYAHIHRLCYRKHVLRTSTVKDYNYIEVDWLTFPVATDETRALLLLRPRPCQSLA